MKPPPSVTVTSLIFIIAGAMGLVYHAGELHRGGAFQYGVLLVLFIRLLAIVAGVFLLRGSNWARWLAVLWLAFHVGLSALHSASEVLMHAGLLAVITYFLFRRASSAYFGGSRATELRSQAAGSAEQS